MIPISLRLLKPIFILALLLWPVQSPGFYVALDPNALNLDAHSGHEELTRQAYEYLQNKWKAEGHGEYYSRLENEFDALYQITRGAYATDVPNGNYILSLAAFWQFPPDILQWHRNPSGQHLHALRNRTADGAKLESAREACIGTKQDVLKVLSQAFDYLEANKKTEYLFLVGHGLHIIQDSFAPAHTRRQPAENYHLTDLCYFGDRLAHEQACYHEANDRRDYIWLTKDLTEPIILTRQQWEPHGEMVKTVDNLESFVLSNVPEADKKTYLRHEARLAKIASIRYLQITLDPVLAFPGKNGKADQDKKEFVDKIIKLLDGSPDHPQRGNTEAYDDVMPAGIMNCSELK
ncbi:MAG TPA: hypothetical protein PK022_04465 [Syntrophales bacterium]|nr:hypothetical protein [Syntrophales bacterium]